MRHRRAVRAIALMTVVTGVPAALQQLPGLVIERVTLDSPAAKLALTPGDRVLSYDGRPVRSPAALQAAEENSFDKDTFVLEVQRGGDMLTLRVPRGPLGILVRPALSAGALRLYEDSAPGGNGPHAADAASWLNAAQVARDAGEVTAAAWLYTRGAEIHEGERRWKDAADAHQKALAQSEEDRDPAVQSRTFVALGRASENTYDFAAALHWYERAAAIDRAAGHEAWLALDLAAMGNAALSRSDLTAAHSHHSQALAIRERLSPDSLQVAASVHGLAEVAYTRGDLSLAQQHLDRALALRVRLAPDSLDLAATLQSVGNVAYRRGNHAAAETAYNRALAIRDRLAAGSLDVAATLNTLGNLGVERGDLASAEDFYRRALDIRERLAPGSLGVATTLSNLGVATNARGDLAAAETLHKRAIDIRERLAPGSLDVASGLTNLGSVAGDRGDLAAAEGFYRRALDIRERLAPNSLSVALSLFNLGSVARNRGDFATADEYLRRSLRIREQLAPESLSVAISLTHLGKLARERGELTMAKEYHSRALALHERLAPGSPYISVTLNDLGLVEWSRGDAAAAHGYLRRALALREKLGPDSLDVAESLNNLGGITFAERRFADAMALFSRAVAIVESRRWQVGSADGRALLLAQHARAYAGLMRAQLAMGDRASAFTTAERARARSLLDILAEAGKDIRQGVDPLLLARERALQQSLNDKAFMRARVGGTLRGDEEAAALNRELDALLAEYRDVQAELRVKSPRYAALAQPQPLALADVQQQLLDEHTLLLEYVLGDEDSQLFAVGPTSIETFALPRRAEIERVARRVYELMTARQTVAGESARQRQDRVARADAEYPAAAAELSRIALGPLAGRLGDKRLLIVADGALHYVPFSALPEPVAMVQSPTADQSPLMVSHEIVSVPSASVLAVLRREFESRPAPERLVAVVADPVFDTEDPRLRRRGDRAVPIEGTAPELERALRDTLPLTERGALSRLPFTRDEAGAIFGLAPAGQRAQAVDFDASRTTIASPEFGRYRFVHLATHGILNTEHPELSGLVLSLVDREGRWQDGFLRLHEVYNLNWSAELVVLSACQTALGQEIRGEGLVGLTRGFMYGGAKRVVASLWNVNDGATAQLMKHFYQGLLASNLSPGAALRAAQLEMWKRRQWRSPYYWAAFVLQGEWR